MKSTLMSLLLLVTSTAFAQANAKPTTQIPRTVPAVLDRGISALESELVPLAEAMPEEKYTFAPTQGEFSGVRDFGAQVRHVAATSFHLAAAILGEKPPAGSEHDVGPDNLKTKGENIQYLKGSFAYLHKAMLSITEKNMLVLVPSPYGGNQTTRLRIAVLAEGHPYDHYGQMVEYARMNGIIPPASRPQPPTKPAKKTPS